MVTFALPGDDVADTAGSSTPKPSRAPLPFAKRAFASSPYGGAGPAAKRLGTPLATSTRKTLMTRNGEFSSSLTPASITTARNIFRTSTISDSPPATSFSPSLPASTKKRVFAPHATSEASRVHRDSIAQATPRGMAAKSDCIEPFSMKIPPPSSDLTGEALQNRVPKNWSSKSSIYADQFLADLCPPEFDDEQRRQFFCILDLRRLKYAADEIFVGKDWKLNIINFAKEFEKSRSIILLHYGLYEFQKVKPSKEVLKRWRRDHGLPEPEEEQTQPTPSKSSAPSKKRKATEDDSRPIEASIGKKKRQAPSRDEDTQPAPAAVPEAPLGSSKNKRKASADEDDEDQPAKMQRSTPSSAKSLFEKAVYKASAPTSSNPPEPDASVASKPFNAEPAHSVFNTAKPAVNGANIFGHLSDSSAKNSVAGADGESDSTDSDVEQDNEKEGDQSNEPAPTTAPSCGGSIFSNKPTATGLFGTNSTSAPGTRESTPGRSLFERVTKDTQGEPLRAENAGTTAAEKAAPADQTWNPSTTPIKFAPPSSAAAQSVGLFGNTAPAPSSSIFAPKATASSSIFGAAQQDQQTKQTTESPAPASAPDGGKDSGESDKENESQGPKKYIFEPKSSSTPQPSFGGALFGAKPATAEASKIVDPAAKPVPTLFGVAKPGGDSEGHSQNKPRLASASNESMPVGKAADAATAPPSSNAVLQSSTLFGAKPAESQTQHGTEASKPSLSLFGSNTTTASTTNGATSGSLFGSLPSTGVSNAFGVPASAAKPEAAPPVSQSASAPAFTFGGISVGADKLNATSASQSLFAPPRSPTATGAAKNIFDGSPMKQDEHSPAKKAFFGSKPSEASATPQFSFGQSNDAPSSHIFGAVSNPPATNGTGGSAANQSGFSFSLGAGSSSSGGSFTNPFASANGGNNPSASAINFDFGASSVAPSTGNAGPFQFGETNGTAPASSGSGLFGGNQTGSSGGPSFGASFNSPATPSFSFTGGPTRLGQDPSSNVFGSINSAVPAFNLQLPANGASTTGTSKSPFPSRKIKPLKRRL